MTEIGFGCLLIAGLCPHGNDNAPGECFECLAGTAPKKPRGPMPTKRTFKGARR